MDDKVSEQKSADLDISYQIEMICARYNRMTKEEKLVFKKQLNELAFPTTSSMVAPPFKVKTKGAPKKKKQKLYDAKRDPSGWEHVDEKMKLTQVSPSSCKNSSQRSSGQNSSQRSSNLSQTVSKKLTHQGDTKFNLPSVPHHVHSYIDKIIDVERDGNCGFRAVALGLNLGEDSWPIIRQDLIKETKEREDLYIHMFGRERLRELRESLSIEYPGFQKEDKWLSLPEMGYFIATKYNVALVQLSLDMNFTYLPLRGTYSFSKNKIISILNVRGIHWMHISISPSCLLPLVALMWSYNRSDESTSWLDPYIGRFALWQSTAPAMARLPPTDVPTVVDLADDSNDLH